MKKLFILLTFKLLLITSFCFSQNTKIDSLLTLLKTDKEDSNKVIHLFLLSEESENDADVLMYAEQSLLLSEKLNFKKGIANAAVNMGYVYNHEGQIKEALNYYYRALKIQEEINDKKNIASSLNNIGFVYYNQGQLTEALDFYKRSLKIREEIKNKMGIANSLNNIGLVYSTKGQLKEALTYYQRAVKIEEEINHKDGIANALNNIAAIYYKQGAIKDALFNFKQSLEIRKAINNKPGIASAMSNIGRIYFKQKEYALALAYGDSSLKIAKSIGYPENISRATMLLYDIYKQKKQWQPALEMYELYIVMRDSTSNAETKKNSLKKQLLYEYNKKEALTKAEQEKTDAINAQQRQKQSIIIYAVAGLLVLIAIFALFMFNRFRITNRQKVIIEKQKQQVDHAYHELHEKNKEVLDSIRYAKRIQTALLTSDRYITKSLNRLIKDN